MKVPLAGPHRDTSVPQEPPDLRQTAAQIVTPSSPPPAEPTPPKEPLPPPPPMGHGAFRFLPFVVGAIVVLLILFLAIRVIPGFFKSKGTVELTYWGLWEEESVINSIIADYQRDNPNVKITYQKQDIKQYRETLTNRLAQEGGPDIFRFHNTWVPMFRDLLAPVPSSVYSSDKFEDMFYPVAQKDLRVGTTHVGIPLEIDTLALFVNEDDFKAAGLSPPKTWDELRNAARQLTVVTSDGTIQKGGAALGTFDNVDHASDIIALMMLQNGVDMKKVDQSLSRDGRNLAEDTLNYYVSFGKGDQKVWDDTLDPSTLAFAKEKVAMYFGYSWRVFEIRTLNPNLRFKVVPIPQLPGATKTFASYWAEGVSKKSTHQKEAFAFLAYLSSKETMQKLFTEQSKLRQFGEPYSRMDLADSIKSNATVFPFVELARDAVSWHLASDTHDNGVNDRMIKYLGDAVRSMHLQNISAKTALETLAKGIAEVSTQYGL